MQGKPCGISTFSFLYKKNADTSISGVKKTSGERGLFFLILLILVFWILRAACLLLHIRNEQFPQIRHRIYPSR